MSVYTPNWDRFPFFLGISRVALSIPEGKVGAAVAGADQGNTGPFGLAHAAFCDLAFTAGPAERSFIRGDADASGEIDITDAIFVLSHLFTGGPAPPCLDAADVNDDGSPDISDPVALLGHLFLGGEPPPSPFPGCGLDPTADGLECPGAGTGC